jgi:hypothetical protein
MTRNGRSLTAGLLGAFVARARKDHIELTADQFFDELPHGAVPDPALQRWMIRSHEIIMRDESTSMDHL